MPPKKRVAVKAKEKTIDNSDAKLIEKDYEAIENVEVDVKPKTRGKKTKETTEMIKASVDLNDEPEAKKAKKEEVPKKNARAAKKNQFDLDEDLGEGEINANIEEEAMKKEDDVQKKARAPKRNVVEENDDKEEDEKVAEKEKPVEKPKKARKPTVEEKEAASVEPDVEEVVEMPRRGKRAAAAASKLLLKEISEHEENVEKEKPKKGRKAAKKQIVEDKLDEEQLEEVGEKEKPKRGKKVVAEKQNVEEKSKKLDEEEAIDQEKPNKRGKKVVAEKQIVEENKVNDELEEEVIEKPKRGKKATADKEAADEKATKVGKEDKNDVEEQEKPKRGRRVAASKQNVEETSNSDVDEENVDEEKPKKGKKAAAPGKQLLNKVQSDYDSIDFTCTAKNSLEQAHNLKIASWNVGGVRAWLKKDTLQYIEKEQPDILCLQEVKCNLNALPDEIKSVEGYKGYWAESKKEGYAGVGILTKMLPISITYGIQDDEQDEEGRCITLEYSKFYLINVYVPNAGRKLVTLDKRLRWNAILMEYIRKLDGEKPVVLCGDLNVAHQEIDLANPKTNHKNAGFTKEERDGMTDLLDAGFVDCFRSLYPDRKDSYSFWTYQKQARAKNVGWRLDYFIISQRLNDSICDVVMRQEINGSDHCPITLFIHI